MDKALVTGGAGFIGSNLTRLLLEKDIAVKVIDNLSTGYEKNLTGLDIEFVRGDICDFATVEKAVVGVDTVFHLAASVGRQKSLVNPQVDSEVNMIGTVNVLEAARKASVKRIVYSSSAAIFGELLTMPISEDHPQNPDSPYGVSKLAGEKQVLCFGELYNMVVVCLRYFNVYGVRQRFDAYGNVIPIFTHRIFNHQPITIYGDGEQTRDFVNVKDVAMANYLSATVAEKSGVYNLGSGENITINGLAKMLESICGQEIAIQYKPMRPADVRHCRADISKAQQGLGFAPDANIQAGLKEYYAWFVEDTKDRKLAAS